LNSARGADAVEIVGGADELLHALAAPATWQLHVKLLQKLPAVEIPGGRKEVLHRLLMRDLSHPNKFVRAWAYGGLATLAHQFPEFEGEVSAIFALGLRDESAAVKARIRNARGKPRASRGPGAGALVHRSNSF